MSKVVITGSTGFIGEELTGLLRSAGHEVFRLGRRQAPADHAWRWQLGEEMPAACENADGVIHLASATLIETKSTEAAARTDIDGSRRLIGQVRRLRRLGRRVRFLFLSSQSARAGSQNRYGQSKWAIEQMLTDDDEIVVRPGLVYGDRPASVFGMFDRISRLPVVPVLSARAVIQPIHVRELAEALVQLAVMPNPPRLVQLAATQPLTFQQAICGAARRAGRPAPIAIKLPVAPVRFALRLADRVFGLRLTERLDGLIGLNPMDTEPSLNLLGRTIRPFFPAETSLSPVNRS